MGSKTSAIRVRKANPVGRLCQPRMLSRFTEMPCNKKTAGPKAILQLSSSELIRLVFDDHALDRAMFSWARVINAHLLTSSQRSCHHFAGAVNNSRGCA